ncbi:MAG: hypothetical protein WDN46_22195 [Methylocella sp.]
MAEHQRPAPDIAAIHADAPAEHLFFAQYRHWMAGYATRDMFFWDCAWDALLRFLPPESAKALYSEFHLFTRILNQRTQRAIGWRPDVCRCLCHDEYCVLKLVTASQRSDAEREFLAAVEMLGINEAPALLNASRSLAQALEARNFLLTPVARLSKLTVAPCVPHTVTLH